MRNNIGERIKTLRKKLGITQEKLADHLGITFQAVSRWESGLSYPDLEILPSLANYFNVTTDELLGVDLLSKQERIDEIRNQVQENFQKGLIDENIAILRTAVNEFPNDYGLLSDLAFFLHVKGEYKEAISLYERIWADCPDNKIRYNSIQFLAYAYKAVGDMDKALEFAEELPHITHNELIGQLLDGNEKVKHLQSNFMQDCETLARNITSYAFVKYNGGKEISASKRIEALKKAMIVYETIFENKDYGFYNERLHELCLQMATQYMVFNDVENALNSLEKAAEYAIRSDTLPEPFVHTSLLFENYEHTSKSVVKSNVANNSHEMLQGLGNKIYDPIRYSGLFKAVVARLKQYAKEV